MARVPPQRCCCAVSTAGVCLHHAKACLDPRAEQCASLFCELFLCQEWTQGRHFLRVKFSFFVIYPALKAKNKNGKRLLLHKCQRWLFTSLSSFLSFPFAHLMCQGFFGQHFFHFPVDLYQLKQPGIFGSILCDGLTSLLIILGMGAALPLWICIDQSQNWTLHSKWSLAFVLSDLGKKKESNFHPIYLNWVRVIKNVKRQESQYTKRNIFNGNLSLIPPVFCTLLMLFGQFCTTFDTNSSTN